ncbi:MAG TPA: hypothetical protein PKA82_00585 [Pyrinomonadaceae bacterium]|nr:hypothetical protein [Pyrinomonadaceae bacterium]
MRDRIWQTVLCTAHAINTEEFQVFNGRQFGRAIKKVARVTLGAFGTFYLNAQAFEELGSPAAVEMLFDRGRRRIGLRPVPLMLKHAFKIVPHTSGGYHRLSASAFCHHHGIFFKGTLLFHDIRIDESNMMKLDLVTATIVTRGAR